MAIKVNGVARRVNRRLVVTAYIRCVNRGTYMPLVKNISKHGNSAGIILEQAILRILGWEVGTEVEVLIKGDSIVLKRHPKHPRV